MATETRHSVRKTRQIRNQAAQIRPGNGKSKEKKTTNKKKTFINNNVIHISGSRLKKKKQVKLHEGVQRSEGREGERASAGVLGSPE